jgi:hypothetical protein
MPGARSKYTKRILSIACVVGVLYTALARMHILWHLLTMHHQDFVHPAFLLSLLVAVVTEILCFVGGALLLLGGGGSTARRKAALRG